MLEVGLRLPTLIHKVRCSMNLSMSVHERQKGFNVDQTSVKIQHFKSWCEWRKTRSTLGSSHRPSCCGCLRIFSSFRIGILGFELGLFDHLILMWSNAMKAELGMYADSRYRCMPANDLSLINVWLLKHRLFSLSLFSTVGPSAQDVSLNYFSICSYSLERIKCIWPVLLSVMLKFMMEFETKTSLQDRSRLLSDLGNNALMRISSNVYHSTLAVTI